MTAVALQLACKLVAVGCDAKRPVAVRPYKVFALRKHRAALSRVLHGQGSSAISITAAQPHSRFAALAFPCTA